MGNEEFYNDLMQEIWARADVESDFVRTAFVESFANYLVDAGEFDTFDLARHISQIGHGVEIDGYAGDPIETEGILTLLIADFRQEPDLATLTRTEIERIFRRLQRFFESSLQPAFYSQMEESSQGYGIARLIHERKSQIRRLRLFLISNRVLSEKVAGMEDQVIAGIPASFNVWDLSRLNRLVASGRGKEDIDLDLRQDFGQTVPCLPAHLRGADYESYLTCLPGALLADIYDRWGARLLEQNVRCFLQARGNVNKGIRRTVLNEPQMFFAYNNGITATAEEIETEVIDGVVHLTRIRNLQIVNGGQTKASIFTCRRKDKADLSNLFVQMKLSIVEPERTMEVVPRISEYANSQNRVNAADFFANHPFHVRMEEFSRRIFAPSPDGTFRESKWFYERARGQYLDAQSALTPGQKKRFQQEFPRNQVFTKTDLAKFENVWLCLPHIVSKGAQFNFAQFARDVGKRWTANEEQFNEYFYRSAIGRAIIFKWLEKAVSEQKWYDGGYRANIVAYTLSKLADMIKQTGKNFDFLAVWQRQSPSQALKEILLEIALEVHGVLTNPAAGISNVTEWAKKPACWERVRGLDIPLPQKLHAELVDADETRHRKRDASRIQRIDDSIEAQEKVLGLGAEFWSEAARWARSNRIGSDKDHQIMDIAARIPSRLPSEKQSAHLVKLLDRLKEEGCPIF